MGVVTGLRVLLGGFGSKLVKWLYISFYISYKACGQLGIYHRSFFSNINTYII